VEQDWAAGRPRRFVAAERPFGQPEPVRLDAGAAALFVRGQIDRIDVEGALTLVRDIKTGRAHPRIGRAADPDPVRDVQIAVYGLVARELAARWGVPPRVAAAYVYVGRGAEERSWRDDFDSALAPAAREWLAVAAGLLAERRFPRTPNADDCAYCRFRPVCGDDAPGRAAEVLRDATGTLARFRALKTRGADDD
jgi:RecB family exonuclease